MKMKVPLKYLYFIVIVTCHLVFIALGVPVVAAETQTDSVLSEDNSFTTINYDGIFSFSMDNDTYYDQDSNYTAGGRISWLSNEIDINSKEGFYPKLLRAFSFLPAIGSDDYTHQVGFSLGLGLSTASDIEDPDPPETERPYAGIWFFNTTLNAYTEKSLQTWTLTLGWMGPSTHGEDTQNWIHKQVGSPEAQGWDEQLEDEPILNVWYRFKHRLLRNHFTKAFDYDIIGGIGGGLGNFYTGASINSVFRIGYNLPMNFGPTADNLTDDDRNAVLANPPRDKFYIYVYAGVGGMAMAQYLTLDGNTFEDSHSIEKENLVGIWVNGLSLGYKRFAFTMRHAYSTDLHKEQHGSYEFASTTISWYF
jgi:hypothetical protein